MSAAISFVKLSDNEWGVRVHPHTGKLTGQSVEVRKRNGGSKQVTVGALEMVSGGTGYYHIAGSARPAGNGTGAPTAPTANPRIKAGEDWDIVCTYLHQRVLAGDTDEFINSLASQVSAGKGLTQRQLDAALRGKAKREERTAAPTERKESPSVTQPGVYEMPDGLIVVVKWNKGKTGLYANRLIELNTTRLMEDGTVVPNIEFEYDRGLIYKVTPEMKMPLERAKGFTIRYGKCIVCGRKLERAESVERGIGPVCIKSFA